MTGMVEIVARALHKARQDKKWSEVPEWDTELFEDARAAIGAMREPTEAMIDACPFLGWEAEGSPTEIWQAMIDSALKD